MPITNLKHMIKKAHSKKYAIPHFNVNNLEQIKAVLETAQKEQSPVVLALTHSACLYIGGYKTAAQMIKNLVKDLKISIPVVIHLDHATYDNCIKAVDAGFTSVMFDGSDLPFKENYQKTKKLREITKAKNISIEAEVGVIGGKEDGVKGGKGELAKPDECIKMQDLKIDALAAGIGNIHGKYPKNWKGLSFTTLQKIKKSTKNTLPMVLHGGSGIPKKQVKKAISLGIAKFNVGTQLHDVNAKAIKKYFDTGQDHNSHGTDIRKVNKPGFNAMKKFILSKIEFCGSAGKA